MLREMVFNELEAINHLEKVHGRKVRTYRFGSNGYGDPRFYCDLLPDTSMGWTNPVLYPYVVANLFFPKNDVDIVSVRIDPFAGIVRMIVRDKEEE